MPNLKSAGSGATGNPSIQAALTIISQLNVLIPVAITAGSTIIGLIQEARRRGEVSESEAEAAVARFTEVSRELRENAEQWLRDHPPTE